MSYIEKHYKFIIFLLIIILIYLIYRTNNYNNLTYISLGDAYALGVDSYNRIDYGYSDYLKDYLIENKELNFYTKAYSSKDMSIEKLYNAIITNKKMIYNNKKLNLKELIRESDFLTLTIGLNDLLYKISITPNLSNKKLDQILDELDQSFTKLIDEIKKYYYNDIYYIGYYESKYYNKYINYSLKKLNERLSKNPNIIFISTEQLFKNKPNLTSNTSLPYPNSQGYKEIANLIISKIKN